MDGGTVGAGTGRSADLSAEDRVLKLVPIPDKLVVLTIDDCNKSDRSFVAKEGKKHGHGVRTFSDGGTYDGEWKCGMPHHGRGVQQLAVGDVGGGQHLHAEDVDAPGERAVERGKAALFADREDLEARRVVAHGQPRHLVEVHTAVPGSQQPFDVAADGVEVGLRGRRVGGVEHDPDASVRTVRSGPGEGDGVAVPEFRDGGRGGRAVFR